jgi:hypothetical protein
MLVNSMGSHFLVGGAWLAVFSAAAFSCSKDNEITSTTVVFNTQKIVCQGAEEANPMCAAAQVDAVCVYGFCRDRCTADFECEKLVPGTACLPTHELGVSACQLPDEIACSDAQPCFGPLVCLDDGRCRAPCDSDNCSLKGLACENGACVGTAEGLSCTPGRAACAGDVMRVCNAAGDGIDYAQCASEEACLRGVSEGACADYPSGPYGSAEGMVIRDLALVGLWDPPAVEYVADESTAEPVFMHHFFSPDDGDYRYLLITVSCSWEPVVVFQSNQQHASVEYWQSRGLQFMHVLFEGTVGQPANLEDLSAWTKTRGVSWPAVVDPAREFSEFPSLISAFPGNIVVDLRDMRIVLATSGAVDCTESSDQLNALISAP